MSVCSKLSTLARLSPRERRAVVRMAPAALVVSAGLGRIPVTSLLRLLGLRAEFQARPNAADQAQAIRNASFAVGIWARNWPGMSSCLPRALVLTHALRAHGAVLRIGVARGASQEVAAHAWVDVDGRSLDGPSAADAPRVFLPLRHAGCR
ncbi:MAG: lasso peptide biosynthesis B2 protein [Polyangiaceae bacterium]|nr:lasso peptide biosynthesis B2 protein [Polyangiaceae bacterium]